MYGPMDVEEYAQALLTEYAELRQQQVFQLRELHALVKAHVKSIVAKGRQADKRLERVTQATAPDKMDGDELRDAEDAAHELGLNTVTADTIYELLSGPAAELPERGPSPRTVAKRLWETMEDW